MGLIVFGVIYAYLALGYSKLFFQSHFLVELGGITLFIYAVLAKRYWFILPLLGFIAALGCYVAGLVTAYA